MQIYVTDINEGDTFEYRGIVYMMVKHGQDTCLVRQCAVNVQGIWKLMPGKQDENFNSYAYVTRAVPSFGG